MDSSSLWLILFSKTVSAGAIYSLILLIFEQEEYRTNLNTIIRLLGIERLKGYIRKSKSDSHNN
jgi:hypothetical protein